MQDIPTTRAAHVISFCDILRKIGTPVERALARSNLPVLIEEMPDELVNNIFATEFTARCAVAEGIDDLGWLAASGFASSQMSAELVAGLQNETTVKRRLEKFFALTKLEDSHFRTGFGRVNGSTQVIGDMDLPDDIQGRDISDWVQVACLVEILRSVAGPTWCPERITFTTEVRIADAARAAFPNTRFETGATHTSIIFPTEHLSITDCAGSQTAERPESLDAPIDGLDLLRRLLRPYLREATMPIDKAADLIGTSRRSLQRRLQAKGVSYSGLIETVRFEMAAEMLQDPELRLLDIAQAVGFEDQSNFGRSFRRVAGISPGRYRRGLDTGKITPL
ncbi:helix-turn-helix transcriptional regulator [Aliiruegeria sabulilitoris]|uniref:helix-turn-helix transcriptional regulator n=1 Tax=Aliiruegeria sabulilitoris TaxID=1510458 RepID=UPI0008299DC9|nr:helix-turn-helix transcriptional regulator [Aliiruegeria sabulilitoris]NDR58753.1 helix-turn-helix transcriptional regulator [Pseudoruegeria sp. M32A2M]